MLTSIIREINIALLPPEHDNFRGSTRASAMAQRRDISQFAVKLNRVECAHGNGG